MSEDCPAIWPQCLRLGRLRLQQIDLSHVPQFMAIWPSVAPQLLAWPRSFPWVKANMTEADVSDYCWHLYSQQAYGLGAAYGVFTSRSADLMGCISLSGLQTRPVEVTLGYWLQAQYQGQGVMREALSGLIEYIQQQQLAQTVSCWIEAANTRSCRLAQHLGFKLVSTEQALAQLCTQAPTRSAVTQVQLYTRTLCGLQTQHKGSA